MTTETLTMSDGVLTLTREGRKLVKVNFVPANSTRRILHLGQIEEMKNCKHCGWWLDLDEDNVWRDFAGHFLCRKSPTCMHAAE